MDDVSVVEFFNYRRFVSLQDGSLPLVLAAHRGHTAIVDSLLKVGADADGGTAVNEWGDWMGKYWFFDDCGFVGARCSALRNAAHGGHADIVHRLLKAGADVNRASGNVR